MQRALARHDEIMKDVVQKHGGFVFKMVGDACCATFPTAVGALEAALAAQRTIHSEPWDEECRIRVRMALHSGEAEERDGDYFGPPVNRVARLLSAGHGGQTLLSLTTQELVRDQLPSGTALRDLGERHLKDRFRSERVFQLVTSDLPQEFPPLRTLESLRNNLPAQPTPLVGREREVGDVCERLRQGETHLLTLTGPGGTGKTRLALQAGANLLEDFETGVFFVELATVTNPELFFSEVSGALGLRESGDVSLPVLLKEYLSRRELILILDNFEQLLEAAPLVGEILAAAPRVKVLATSRIPLDLYGEHEYAVPPLSVPDPKRLPSVETLSRYEAVRLFIERASAAKAGFAITDENAPTIAEICARLDGLPLALELAAARIKLLPPKALLTRLGNRLKLLTGGAKELPARQRTLRGAIEWSYDLLDEGEKALFARLSVFSGGSTLEAVETVCDAEGDLPIDFLEGVSSLLDKSLLRQEEGLELLQEEEEGGEAALFLHMVLGATVYVKGDSERANELIEKGLALSREEESGWATAGFLHNLGIVSTVQGDHKQAKDLFEESLALYRGLGDKYGTSYCLRSLGIEELDQGNAKRAATLLEESVAMFRELGANGEITQTLFNLGWAALFMEDVGRAAALFEEALALSREAVMKTNIVDCLEGLACVAEERGEAWRAARLWGAADVLRKATNYPQDPISRAEMEPYLTSARSRLDEGTFEAAWKEGRAMTEEQAIALALESSNESEATRAESQM